MSREAAGRLPSGHQYHVQTETKDYLQKVAAICYERLTAGAKSRGNMLPARLYCRLTEGELLTTCVTLLTAGHETTTNLIANGLYTLLRYPDELARLRADPALKPAAIEEMLRYESPLHRNPRRVADDFEYGGASLQRGVYVLQMLGAANRDPAVFPEPHRFNLGRQPNRHLAFAFGIHFCVGTPLARLEGPVAIGTVLRRMPDLRLSGEPVQWQQHGLLRGPVALPVTF